MAIQTILAMTRAEIAQSSFLPPSIAWMACHFSPTDAGLSDMPDRVAPCSMVIINDRFPIENHDPALIATQLAALYPPGSIGGLLLDLQRPCTTHALEMTKALVQALPYPVGAPPAYCKELDCPVFLPPIPPHIPPAEYLRPWANREVWLELALNASQMTVTAEGCTIKQHQMANAAQNPHSDAALHCHYCITLSPNAIDFYLYRTREDIANLIKTVANTCVTRAVGLFQELG